MGLKYFTLAVSPQNFHIHAFAAKNYFPHGLKFCVYYDGDLSLPLANP